MRILLAPAGEDLFAFESVQLAGILAWPPAAGLPWGSLHALAGVPAEEPEPRAVLGRAAASGAPFALRVPGPLREEDVTSEEVHPVPPLLLAPPWVRGVIFRSGAPALLLDLPALGDSVLSSASPSSSSEVPR